MITTELIGYGVIIIALFCWYGVMIWKRKEVFTDLRGKDLIWQFVELVAVFWLTFAPAAFASHLLGVSFGEDIWSFLELVFLIAVAGKSAEKIISSRFGNNTPKEITETEVKIKKIETKPEEPIG